MIERRLKSSALLADHQVVADEKLLPKAVEDATRRGQLFAIILKEQNEQHHSLTLNILHGTPQGIVVTTCLISLSLHFRTFLLWIFYLFISRSSAVLLVELINQVTLYDMFVYLVVFGVQMCIFFRKQTAASRLAYGLASLKSSHPWNLFLTFTIFSTAFYMCTFLHRIFTVIDSFLNVEAIDHAHNLYYVF